MTGPEQAPVTPERWQRVEELFHLARERAPADRSAFLDAACAGDLDLRTQVEALVNQPNGPLTRDGLAPLVRQLISAPSGRLEGQTLGPYRLGPLLGAGGMNEVYRARDTKLGRDVAVKILPETLAASADRLARFEREARILAALNHPHVAHLYGLENSEDTVGLVMELVEGPTLADRIAQGAIPLSDALAIADQIAEAVQAAHDQGIIHRDLKPANIKVRPDGTVKVLDFGVAKALEPGSADVARSGVPTVQSPSLKTGTGVIVGTALYMSPEQLKGEPADKKSDVWAFGCVLYEMLTGQSAFGGNDVAAVTASIVRDTPDWSKLPLLPVSIQSLIVGCLEKNPWQRVSDIAVARFAIKQSAHQPAAAFPTLAPGNVPSAARRVWLPWAIAAAALLVAAMLAVLPRRAAAPSVASVTLTAPLGPGVAIRAERGSDLAISRDGTQIAAVAFTDRGPQVFLRRLDQPSFVPIAGTVPSRMPFFSPDGRWIGYFIEPKMYRVPSSGGTPTVVCEGIDDPVGAWWGDDDRIVFGRSSGLWTVAASGGTPAPLMQQPGNQWPQVLPGARAMIFTALHDPNEPDVMVRELPSGAPKVLVKNAYYARYAGTGHLVYAMHGALYAAPFDAKSLTLKGDAVPLVPGVSGTTARSLWTAQYAVSDTGTVVYTTGGAGAALDRSPLTLLSRLGVRSTLVDGLPWNAVRFSPDGNEVALVAGEPSEVKDVMILDPRSGMPRALTLDANNDHASPVWSPDGKKIAFSARRHKTMEPFNLYWRNADGSGIIHRLTTANAHQFAGGWSGKWIAYHEIQLKQPRTGDILVLPVEPDGTGGLKAGTPQPVVVSPGQNNRSPSFSADGRWIAYSSSETGVVKNRNGVGDEVIVRPFHGTGGPWKVGAGSSPIWSPGKSELIFSGDFHQVMVARYSTTDSTFHVEDTKPWPGAVLAADVGFAVAPDGDHIAAGLVDPNADQSVNVVLHMLDALKRP
jgi:serine/threonine-protein kinase